MSPRLDLTAQERRHYERLYPVDVYRPTPKPATFSDLVPSLVESMQLEKRDWIDDLGDQWADLVSPLLAKRSRPQAFRDGVLTLAVDHPAYLAEFRRTEDRRLLRDLQGRFPESGLQRLRWVVSGPMQGG